MSKVVVLSTAGMRKLRKKMHGLGMAGIPGATVRALNRAAKSTQTAILREESRRFGITQRRLKRRVRFQRRDEAVQDRLGSKVFLVVSKVPASYFGKIKEMEYGVRVKGKFYNRAFSAETKSGHIGVFQREYSARGRLSKKEFLPILFAMDPGRKKTYSLPIKEIKEDVRTPMVEIADTMIERVGVKTFRERFRHELDRVMKER